MIKYVFTILLLCISLALTVQSLQERSSNSSEKVDLVTFVSTPTQESKLLQEKCIKNGSTRRCRKLKEKAKQNKQGSINDIWNDVDMLQHPIDEEPRRMDRTLGEMCLYSSDCISGCCMLDRETKIRSCQPKSIKGEKCTTAQIKADLYVDVCPCLSGDSNCIYPGEYCSK